MSPAGRRVWRLCRRRHAATAFSGEGARLYGGRWNPRGSAVVYTSQSVSLAALETLVHLDPEDAPADLVVIPVDVPSAVDVREVAARELPARWRTTPAPAELQQLGADWLRRGDTAVLSVPSAVVPQERNYLLSPAHPQFAQLTVGEPEPFAFDPRLWK